MKGNNQKTSDKERQQDEKDGALDQIKKKYGFSSSSYESTAAKRARIKLHENTKKLRVSFTLTKNEKTVRISLSYAIVNKKIWGGKSRTYLFTYLLTWQGINLRATEMQDTAKSFSSLAKQVLQQS
ncbi:hypothetical protein JHK87_001930 [Glycine soja]|nr:hypothetical protein JHK87_001930 [Glycine soja]